MGVKVIPQSDAYRAGWDVTFGGGSEDHSPCGASGRSVGADEPSRQRESVADASRRAVRPTPSVRIIGPAIWPFNESGGVMDFRHGSDLERTTVPEDCYEFRRGGG
jgi:hypothetical protein